MRNKGSIILMFDEAEKIGTLEEQTGYRRLMLELVADIRDVLVSLKEEECKWNKETK